MQRIRVKTWYTGKMRVYGIFINPTEVDLSQMKLIEVLTNSWFD